MIYLGRGIVAFAAITASAVGVAIVRDWSQMLTGIVIGVCAVGFGVAISQLSGAMRVRLYEREAGHHAARAGRPWVINAGASLPASRDLAPFEVVEGWAQEVEA